MNDIQEISGAFQGAGRRFGIVASRFNGRIVDLLVAGAVDCLLRHGVAASDLRVVRVPGAWEIPAALDELARLSQSGDPGDGQSSGHKLDGLVALGVVIRGETPHFDYVCSRCASGVAAVEERHRLPVGFGVLTCDTSQQAEERAGGKAGNKGWDAALAALEMADLFARLRG